ncbi:preprotein translocase subunit YajC [Ligilactobacillus hohenheimensis]|uniref:preprotein translocase subunit YajC n=1 Tax=Ligilactobacillus hohenheimensis TaxID=2991832 RepID=UPI001FA57CB9|nr:preprotein translocase subunit YajC [Ligilactobacillus hohenheimensis]HJC04319.1 preprotein translocase subunit YajC [Candidatus Ligilactobacillus avistercoris]
MGSVTTIIMFVVLFVLMYFIMIRPQKKQQQQHQEMINSLHVGDHVVMISRLHGKIDKINKADGTVSVDCDGIYLTFDVNAVMNVIPATAGDEISVDEELAEKDKDKQQDADDDSAEDNSYDAK